MSRVTMGIIMAELPETTLAFELTPDEVEGFSKPLQERIMARTCSRGRQQPSKR